MYQFLKYNIVLTMANFVIHHLTLDENATCTLTDSCNVLARHVLMTTFWIFDI